MNTYRLPTSDQNTRIYGRNFVDAIENNLKRVATVTKFDRDERRTYKITHPVEEVYCQWSGGIIGGKGGVVVIMRGNSETYEAWLEVDKSEWEAVAQGQEMITLQCSPIEGANQLHDNSTGRVNRRNEQLDGLAQELGFDSLSQFLTAWKNREVKITVERLN